jgi:hypothetical protein
MNPGKKLFVILMLVFIGQALAASLSYGQPQKAAEYHVKAAFIYNLVKFIEWPNKDWDQKPSIILGVFGDDPFDDALDSLQGKSVRGKEIIVKKISSFNAIKKCDILFISGSEKDALGHILKDLSTLPVLTIGDTESFASKGVMINFYIENDRVKFEINTDASKGAGFRIHSNLMKLGKIVSGRSNEKRSTDGSFE